MRMHIDWPQPSGNRSVANASTIGDASVFGVRFSFGFRLSVFGFLLLLFAAMIGVAQPAVTPGDQWLAKGGTYPRLTGVPATNQFSVLWAEVIAGKLKVTWASTNAATNTIARLHYSVDEPGHWPAREWRSLLMTARGGLWDATLPIVTVDVPVVYYVAAHMPGGATNLSAMRVCTPRLAGLEQPSRVFWPFLEGFEEGLDQWRLLDARPNTPPLATHDTAVNGYAALKLNIDPGSRSASAGTTVLRSWHLTHFSARGLQLWARTKTGEGELTISALAQAFTPGQATLPSPARFKLGAEWKKLEVSLDFIPEARRAEVDFLVLQFSAAGPAECWLDDLSLLGRWKLELE